MYSIILYIYLVPTRYNQDMKEAKNNEKYLSKPKAMSKCILLSQRFKKMPNL